KGIQDILNKEFGDKYDLSKYKSGAAFYDKLAEDLSTEKTTSWGEKIKIPNHQGASELLNSMGIKGHSYFDQLSRAKGKGTRNYVIYSDKHVNITEKYYNKPIDLQNLAEKQRQIYREGAQQGMTSNELEAATKEIFEKDKVQHVFCL